MGITDVLNESNGQKKQKETNHKNYKKAASSLRYLAMS